MSEESRTQQAGQTPEPIDVSSFLAMVVQQMAELAWQKMGLQPDPITNAIARDMEQAKLAIDAAAALAPVLEAKLDDEDKRQIQNLVRDLRVNYVEKSR